jgi:hypothetical protein
MFVLRVELCVSQYCGLALEASLFFQFPKAAGPRRGQAATKKDRATSRRAAVMIGHLRRIPSCVELPRICLFHGDREI